MTDGCGISNLAFSLKLQRPLKLEYTPCAVQIRHHGKKVGQFLGTGIFPQGMLLMSLQWSERSTPRVKFCQPSQIKIVYSEEAKTHPANGTIDILRFSRTRTPARISPEVIINLQHNHVPAEVFESMQDAYLTEGVDGLLCWARDVPEAGHNKHEDMVQLWIAMEKSEGIYFACRVREAEGEACFHGFRDRFIDTVQEDDDEEPEAFDKGIHEHCTAWWPDYISGQPSSLAKTVMCLLDVGFIPQALLVLLEKLKQIVKTKINHHSQHFKYDVTQSATAFVVPGMAFIKKKFSISQTLTDFWNVLGEDEIHFKSLQ